MKPTANRAVALAAISLCISILGSSTQADQLVDAVSKFADTVIVQGRDRYGNERTPLFVDVLNVDTLKSPEIPKGLASVRKPGVIMSNFAYQQNLLRTLVGLSKLTGEDKYHREAEKTTRYVFGHCTHKDSGLIHWGVHTFVELTGHRILHHENNQHELKSVYPFYDFLYEVAPHKTERFIKSMWLAHIEKWPLMTFNRHGKYQKYDLSKVWDHDWDNPGRNARSNGLAFFNAGSDIIYAGFYLGINADDEKASLWATRLFERFVVGRNETTHIMPCIAFRQAHRERGKAQFKFPNAYEPNLYIKYIPEGVLAHNDYAMLQLAERLDKAGHKKASRKIRVPLCEHLIGYAKYAYDADKNVFKPIINDGTDLSGYKLPKEGYFGAKGEVMQPIPAGVEFMPTYALAYRLCKDKTLWQTLRDMCKGNGLGDIGQKPGSKPCFDYSYTGPYPRAVFAIMEIFKATQEEEYLKFVEHVCQNILRQRYHPDSGLFTLDEDHLACHLDCYEPLALLTVAAAKQNKLDLIPAWAAGGSYQWSQNQILSGYSKKVTRPDVRPLVLRRSGVKKN